MCVICCGFFFVLRIPRILVSCVCRLNDKIFSLEERGKEYEMRLRRSAMGHRATDSDNGTTFFKMKVSIGPSTMQHDCSPT